MKSTLSRVAPALALLAPAALWAQAAPNDPRPSRPPAVLQPPVVAAATADGGAAAPDAAAEAPPAPMVGVALNSNAPLAIPRPEIPAAVLAAISPRPGGLTLEGAVQRALRANPGLAVARANVRVAEAAQAEAGRAMIPTLTGLIRYTRLSDVPAENRSLNFGMLFPGVTIPPVAFPQLLDAFTFQATLTIPVSDIPMRLLRFYQASGYTLEARRIDEETTRLQTALETRLAYVDWLRALGSAAATAESLDSLRRRLVDAERLVAAGTVARVQLLQIRSQVATVERTLLQMQNAVALAELNLRQRTRMPAEEPLILGETFDAPVMVPGNLAELLGQARRNRSELRSLQRQAASLGHTIAGTQASYFPSLSVAGNAYYASPNQRAFGQSTTNFLATWDLSVQLTWTPTQIATAAATVARLEAQRSALDAQAEQLRDGIDTEVRAQWIGARNAVGRIDAARIALESATEVARVRREQFNAGATTATELSNAESELLRAHLDLLDGWLELRVAVARLRRAAGEPEGSPGASR